jgi:hypothetical protein
MPRDPSSSPERSAMTRLGLAAGPHRGLQVGPLRAENRDGCGSGMREKTRRHRKRFRSTLGQPSWPWKSIAGTTSSGAEPGRNAIRRRLLRAPRETPCNMRALGVAQHGPGSPQLVRAPWSGHGAQGRVSRPLTCSQLPLIPFCWVTTSGGALRRSSRGLGLFQAPTATPVRSRPEGCGVATTAKLSVRLFFGSDQVLKTEAVAGNPLTPGLPLGY